MTTVKIKTDIRNKFINLNGEIGYVYQNNYMDVQNDYDKLMQLRDAVKKYLENNKTVVKNKATGYEARISGRTISKIIFPSTTFYGFRQEYIDNLNASFKLCELFENAIYVSTLKPMKNKKNNPNELGYHHFVAPLIMNGKACRVLITVREKINSKILYVVSVEIISSIPFLSYPPRQIKISSLVKDIKIWDYDKNDYNKYNISNIVSDYQDEGMYFHKTKIFIFE